MNADVTACFPTESLLDMAEKMKAKRFKISLKNEVIELKPVEGINSIFGLLPKLDLDKIRKEHEEEVENEDAHR